MFSSTCRSCSVTSSASILRQNYLTPLVNPFSCRVQAAIGCIVIATVVAINSSGLEFSGAAAIVLSLLTLTPVLLLVAFSAPYVKPSNWLNTEAPTDWPVVFAMVLWTLSGFDDGECALVLVSLESSTRLD